MKNKNKSVKKVVRPIKPSSKKDKTTIDVHHVPAPEQFKILPGGSLVQASSHPDPVHEGPENTKCRFILVQIEEPAPAEPGRDLLDALKRTGIHWIKVIYTDPSYIKTKVNSL